MTTRSPQKRPEDEFIDRLIDSLTDEERILLRGDAERLRERTGWQDESIVRLVLCLMRLASPVGDGSWRLSPRRSVADWQVKDGGHYRSRMELPMSLYQGCAELLQRLAGIDEKPLLPVESECEILSAGREVDLVINWHPTLFGVSFLVRPRPRDDMIPALDGVGFSDNDLERLLAAVRRPGLIVVAGPRGSGRSSLVYSALKHLRGSRPHIMTAEERVRRVIAGTGQSRLAPDRGFTALEAVRGMLRQEAEVLYVEEPSETEELRLLLRGVSDGRTAFVTLPSRNALSALRTLRDGLPDAILADGLSLLVATRRVPQNCPECRVEYEPPAPLLDLYDLGGGSFGFQRGAGCDKCEGRGLLGTAFLYEMLSPDEALRAALRRGADDEELLRRAEATGFCPFFETARLLIFDGSVTIENFHQSLRS